ncbi:unnamed protein product, partial [Prorocentrum cordatum]
APAGAAPGPPRGLSLRVAGPGRPTSLVVSWLAPEHLGESPVHAYDVEVAAGELGPCDARWGQAGAAWAVDVTSTPGGLQELSVVVVLAARARGASLSGRVRARNRHGVGAWLQTSCGAPAPAQDCGEAPALQLRGCLLAVSQQGQLSWDAPPGLRGALFQFSLWECPGAATSNMRMRRVLTEQMDLGAPKLLRLTSATRERFPMAKGASYIGEVLALEPGVGCRSLAVAMCLSLACEPRRPVSVPAAASKEQVRAEQMGAEVTFASPPAEQIVKMPLLSLTVQPLVERAGEAAPLEAPIECSAEPMSGNFQTGDLLPREADPCAEQVTPLQLNCAPGQLLDLTEPPVQQGLLDAVVLDLTEPLVQHGPLDAIATEAAPPGVAPSEARELPRLAPQGPARAEAASALRVFGATRGADAHGAPLGLRVARVWPEGAEVRWRGPAALWLLRLQDAASGLSRVEATELGCQGLGVRCEEALEWRHEFHDLRPGRTYVVGIPGHDDHVTLRTPSGDPVACVPWARVKEVGARVVELEWGAAADDAGEYQVSVRSSGGIAPGDVARVELLRQREACTKQSYCVQDLRPDTKYDFELWFSKGGVRSSECISLTAATCSECAEPAPVDDHGTMTDARWEMRASDACLDSSAAELNSVRRRAYDRFQLLVCMLMVILHVSNVALELQRADADFSEERVLVATVAVALPWMLNAVICWVFYQVCRELSTIEDGMVGFRQWLVDNSRLAGCIWILSVMHSGCLNLFKFYMPQRVFDATERASVQNFDHLLLQALRSKAEAEELCGEYARMLAALQGRPAPKPAPARRAAAADVLLAERTPARGAAAEGRLCEVHTPPRPALAWPAPWSPPGGPPQSPPPPADAPEGASASPGAPDHLWGFAVMTPGTVAPEPALAAPAAPCALREAARRPREGDHVAAAAGPPRLEASPTHAALPPPPRLAEAGEGASPAAQEQVFARQISDHSAVTFVIELRARRDPHRFPISSHVLKSNTFTKLAATIEPFLDFTSLSPPSAFEAGKDFLKDMARLARDQLAFLDPRHPATLVQLARAITRVAWRNDILIADRLLRGHPLAKYFAVIHGPRVQLVSAEAFLARPNRIQWFTAERRQREGPGSPGARERRPRRSDMFTGWFLFTIYVLFGRLLLMTFAASCAARGLELPASASSIVLRGKPALAVFMPEVSDPSDGNPEGCLCRASNFRVAWLRITDVKVMALVINRGLMQITTLVAPWPRRGFAAHRPFMAGALELDGAARVRSFSERAAEGSPILFSLDVAQAFPPLAQGCMSDVLRRVLLRPPLLTFLEVCCAPMVGHMVMGSSLVPGYAASSGMAQGRPMSGSPFAIFTMPFATDLTRAIGDRARGTARWRADDDGGALEALLHLKRAHRVLLITERAAAPMPMSAKCNATPLEATFSEQLQSKIMARMGAEAPPRRACQVARALKHLGRLLVDSALRDGGCLRPGGTSPQLRRRLKWRLAAHAALFSTPRWASKQVPIWRPQCAELVGHIDWDSLSGEASWNIELVVEGIRVLCWPLAQGVRPPATGESLPPWRAGPSGRTTFEGADTEALLHALGVVQAYGGSPTDAPGSCSSSSIGADMAAQFESAGVPRPAESNTHGRSEGLAATRSTAVQTDRKEFGQLQRQLEKHSGVVLDLERSLDKYVERCLVLEAMLEDSHTANEPQIVDLRPPR